MCSVPAAQQITAAAAPAQPSHQPCAHLVAACHADELIAGPHAKDGAHREVGVHDGGAVQGVKGNGEALACSREGAGRAAALAGRRVRRGRMMGGRTAGRGSSSMGTSAACMHACMPACLPAPACCTAAQRSLTAQVEGLGHLLRAGQLAAPRVAQGLEQQLVSQHVNRQLLVAKGVDAGGAAAGRGAHLQARIVWGGQGQRLGSAGSRLKLRGTAITALPMGVGCRLPFQASIPPTQPPPPRPGWHRPKPPRTL